MTDALEARRRELERRLAELEPARREVVERAIGSPPNQVPALSTIPRRPSVNWAPLTHGQEMLWLLERASPGHAYNVPRTVRLHGAVDRAALQRALDALVNRHEALRTTFEGDEEGVPRQIIHDPQTVAVHVVDLRAMAVAEREAVAREALRAAARTPFNLASECAFRVTLVQLAADDAVLQLLTHHIVSDAVSGNILRRELGLLYEAYHAGRDPELPPLAVQFPDVAAWQRAGVAPGRLQTLLEYWRRELGHGVPFLDLPTDRPRGPVPQFEGATCSVVLPRELHRRVEAIARQHGATPFMAYLGLLQGVLSRYTGETEVVVGTPVVGRDRPEYDGVIGLFANTLLIKGVVDPATSFHDLLEQVRDSTLGGFEHQDVPLEALLLSREGEPPIASMPQVLFAMADPEREGIVLQGTRSAGFGGGRGATKFELTIHVAPGADELRVTAEYRVDLFDPPTVTRLLNHFGTLIQSAVASPGTPVADLRMIDDAEREALVAGFNQSEAEWPREATIHELFEAQVASRPDAIAIQCASEHLTYCDLNRLANRVARRLIALGVVPDSLVAVCLNRSVDLVAVMLGVLKAGGAYVPIDPDYPDERLHFILSDSESGVVITDRENRARLGDFPGSVMLASEALSSSSELVEGNPGSRARPSHLCYVIYTSGSTGQPKGVLVEHRNVVRLLFNDRMQFDFTERDVWTIFHSFAFDFSVWEMYGALLRGARAIVVPRTIAQQPSRFLDLLEVERVTVLNQTPSAFYVLAQEALARGNLSLVLRYIIFGGESLQPAMLGGWMDRFPEVQLVNMFGITETTVHATFKVVGRAEVSAGVSNIGVPIPTTSIYVLDSRLQPVPLGVTGELCVGGDGVARGYHKRTDLTKERFVPNPLRPGERLYRSGDLGRRLISGELEYLGRRDHQVKVRGHRVELGEIEAILSRAPGVSSTVVLIREDMPGGPAIVGYVVAVSGATLNRRDLREFVRHRLPEVMVPSALVVLPRIPLTPNGKLDRHALPKPEVDSERALVLPSSPHEVAVSAVFADVFQRESISVTDDFFDLGGHSLLAIRIANRLQELLGHPVALGLVLQNPSVSGLAAALQSHVSSSTPSAGPRINAVSRERFRRPAGGAPDGR